jgi:hypothetical protein
MNTIQLIGIYGVIGVVVSLGIDLLVQKFNPISYSIWEWGENMDDNNMANYDSSIHLSIY